MNTIQSFQMVQRRELRTVTQPDGSIWFVAKDVCDILGLDNVTNAVKRLDDDEAALNKIKVRSEDGTEQLRDMNLINEPGLYKLIFSSNKEQAKSFTRWVTHEVLPSIRKTGSYTGTNRLLEGIKARLHHGDMKQMRMDTGLSVDTVKNYLNGGVRKPREAVVSQMLAWVDTHRPLQPTMFN